MKTEFTSEELKEIIRAAYICNPGFGEEKMQTLMELQTRLSESGYLETIEGVAKMEKAQGVSINQVLERSQQLLKEMEKLEKKASLQQVEAEKQQANLREINQRQAEVAQETKKAQRELEEIRAISSQEEQGLAEIRREAVREKDKLAKDIEKYHQKAKITQEELVIASQIKGEIESNGFNLELVLNLAREFGHHLDAGQELAEELQKHQTVRGYTAALEEKNREQKKLQDQEAGRWRTAQDNEQSEIKMLESAQLNLRTGLIKLREDQVYEEELRRFHRRYWKFSGLLDCLATWDQVIFLRCQHPADIMAGLFNPAVKNAHFWTDKPVIMCPHCGLKIFSLDEQPYHAINSLVGAPLRVVLGE